MGRGKQKLLAEVDFGVVTTEARKQVWSGAVPLQLHLHPSEITTLPGPSPFLILAPRNGYLPLLLDEIRPHFNSVLPPGSDTIWFDYQGLPLKWHIPIGVLFDLLVAEPERPWNLTVHFRAYPAEVLTLCEDEAVKWNFINALKEASYVMYGSTKSIMNMSQLDQVELWRCVVKGDLEGYDRIAARLRPGFGGGGNWVRDFLHQHKPEETEASSPLHRTGKHAGSESGKPGRIPVRVYVRTVDQDLDDLFDATPVASWDEVAYTTRPIDLRGEGNILTLRDALMKAVPHLFSSAMVSHETVPVIRESSQPDTPELLRAVSETDATGDDANVDATEIISASSPSSSTRNNTESSLHMLEDDQSTSTTKTVEEVRMSSQVSQELDFHGMVRIQGIEPDLNLPLEWAARNLCAPEHFIHLIVLSTWTAPWLPSGAD